jgi:hypothetical protein
MKFKHPDPYMAGPLLGKDPWPLRFYSHGFSAHCFNTLACSLVYNRRQFGTQRYDYMDQIIERPSGPPPQHDWKTQLGGGGDAILPIDHDGETFPSPVEVAWTSLDGTQHTASLNLDALFRERLVLHNLRKEEITEAWLAGCSFQPVVPEIFVEVNDRTISIYMEALVCTKAEQKPGNPNSHFRSDVILAWTHTY